MKVKRWLVVAAITLLVGAAGAGSMTALAQSATPVHPAQGAAVLDSNEPASAADADTVDEQVGDQSAADTGVEEATSGPDTDNVQDGQGAQVEDGQPDLPGAASETPGGAGD